MKLLACVCILSYSLCTMAQIVLQQKSNELAQPGTSLVLECAVSGYDINARHMYWIRQLSGKGLVWIAAFRTGYTTYINGDFRGRVTPSTRGSTALLQIDRLTATDTAVYYCTSKWGAWFDIWGPGTMVTVTTAPVTVPSVFPLIPCCDGLDVRKEVTFGCLVTGYLPEPVKVTWNSGAISTGDKNFPAVFDAKKSVYTRSSQLTVSGSTWANATYQCNVLHENTGVMKNQSIQVIPCTAPVVKTLLESPCEHFSNKETSNSTMELVCQMTRFFPGTIQARWLVNGEATRYSFSPPAPWKGEDGYFRASSHMWIPKGQWNQGAVYTCVVEHPKTDFMTQMNISKCSENCNDDLQVYVFPPKFEDLYLEHNAKLTCQVVNIRNTENFEITWTRSNGGKLDQVTSDPHLNDNGTSSASNIASICVEDWESGETFICTVKYQEKPTPVVREISKNKEDIIPHQPSVYILPPSTDEVALQEQVSLTCLVKGFKPKNIFIKWLHEGMEMAKENYITTEPIQSQDNNFFLYSQLVVDTSNWNKGNSYTCVVGHEALPMYLTQKSIDKSTGKPSMVNVSLVMSEMANNCY